MLIELTSVTKTFPKSQALTNVSLKVNTGECIGLIGPNGSGKSTLFSLLLGFTRPDSGALSILGSSEPELIRRRISCAPEHPGFYETLSGLKNLELLSHLRNVDLKKSTEVAHRLGLTAHLDKPVNSYSKGLRQRLTLCTCLIGDTELYLLDEPSVGLDPEGIVLLRQLIEELKDKGKTIIVTSHIIAELEKVCTRFVVLNNGHLKLDASIEAINAQYASVETAYLNATL